MSTKQNDEYLENRLEDYAQAEDVNAREAIIEDLKMNGFIKEAETLEEEQKVKDGLDYHNDDINNRIMEANGN
jgi:hypothetical protein